MFNWFRRKKTEQSSDSLENITDKEVDLGRRAFLAGSLAFIAGCAAPGFRPILDRDKPFADEMEKHEFGKSAQDFANENIDEIMKAVEVKPYETPQTLKTAVKTSSGQQATKTFTRHSENLKNKTNFFQNYSTRQKSADTH